MVCQEEIQLNNRLGLHLRASAELVKIASRYHSFIEVACGSRKVNGKSLMALLTLSVSYGMSITVIANGSDAHQALNEIRRFLAS